METHFDVAPISDDRLRKKAFRPRRPLFFVGCMFGLLCASACVFGQTIRVDATAGHSVNSFIPNQTLGAGIDRLPSEATDRLFQESMIKQFQSSGWQPVTYRQNTELFIEAWHWNPKGTWSDPSGKGYFTGSTALAEPLRHSYGYFLPHRGFTRNDGADSGYSRLTDGDLNTYWKSNPYLTHAFTGEDDSLHPQWVTIDLKSNQQVDSIRIAWAEPFARRYLVQYWTGEDPIKKPTKGVWQTFPSGAISNGRGGTETLHLATAPVSVKFIRVLMTESSNTCDSHGSADQRNCVGYAIRELFLGTSSAGGQFHDLVRHTPDPDQTETLCSSVDPWHEPSDLNAEKDQVGFDLFYTSGITRGLPAVVPVAMLYDVPENAAAEIAYIEKRGYPISYVEMGEEPDGQYMQPEDYAELYLQWSAAIHRVDPKIKLGGPVFEGVNEDIETWPDAQGRTSWVRRFLSYLKNKGRLAELSFFSFEHYPFDPCKIEWSSLYDEPRLITHIMQVWRDDGVPPEVPLIISESNISPDSAEYAVDIFGALWLGDYIGSFLTAGGSQIYYFHYVSTGVYPGCTHSLGSFGMFTADDHHQITGYTSQYFASQLINLEWVKPGDGRHQVFPAASDVLDPAGNVLVTAYPVLRPDGEWSLMLVNRDQENAHSIRIVFHDEKSAEDSSFSGKVDMVTFGSEQYRWHPNVRGGTADPDGPAKRSTLNAGADTIFELPKASLSVIRGKVHSAGKSVAGVK
ncbi:MAG TPA: discoidin domain-containing protein [Candidatus Angelobacter sp.]|nr:discoidin domain-containing protein [Candidatus Angelobacter sp.]